MLNKKSIAIVGSRKATNYGIKYAGIFAKELSKAGITIVSGMAVGIDTIAHNYSMKEKGGTIAVLGSGLKNIDSKESKYLYEQIIQNNGCIISEYLPQTKAISENYPRRNRIISGLALGVLVVEARHRSGSRITARHAINQKKEVFCIPNRLDEKTGESPNELIQNGANLVMKPQDILEFYLEIIEEQNKTETIEEPMKKEYKEIYNLIGKIPISANELAKCTKQTIAQISETLCILEIEGFIKCMPGNKYIRITI